MYDLAKDSCHYIEQNSCYVLVLSFKYSSYHQHLSKPRTSSNHIVEINVCSYIKLSYTDQSERC